jgi:type II secretory ATPase GspE/PulE/Tfp pilus assembly ATPase PilB-like protein
MRQDPDVILVGEIRDQETADLALRASITGHLVLSTLHTNDSASAISRLLDLGATPNILASAITMVVAQRLVRRVCPKCAEKVPPADHEKETFLKHDLKPPSELLKHVGCENCRNTGYTGRAGIFETLLIDRTIQELFSGGAHHASIEDAGIRAGTTLMLKQGLKKVSDHITTLEEVFRVIADA